MVVLLPIVGAPLPTFSDALVSVTVLAVTTGSPGVSDWPALRRYGSRRIVLAWLVGVEGHAARELLRPRSFGRQVIRRRGRRNRLGWTTKGRSAVAAIAA
jgi:hypothetical protein